MKEKVVELDRVGSGITKREADRSRHGKAWASSWPSMPGFHHGPPENYSLEKLL